jgi:hypothetical protein
MKWGVASTCFSGGKNLMPGSFPKNISGLGRGRENVQVGEFIVGTELSSDHFESQWKLFGELSRELKITCQRRAKLRNRGTSAYNGLTAALGGIDLYYQVNGMTHDLLPPACMGFFAGAAVRCSQGDFFPITAERLAAGMPAGKGGHSAAAGAMDIVIGYEPHASAAARKIAGFIAGHEP